jgi:hypothetical protein
MPFAFQNCALGASTFSMWLFLIQQLEMRISKVSPKNNFFWWKQVGEEPLLEWRCSSAKGALSWAWAWYEHVNLCSMKKASEHIMLKGFKDLTMLWEYLSNGEEGWRLTLALGWGPKRAGIETSTSVRTFTWDMIWPRVEIWDLKFLSSYSGYIV